MLNDFYEQEITIIWVSLHKGRVKEIILAVLQKFDTEGLLMHINLLNSKGCEVLDIPSPS